MASSEFGASAGSEQTACLSRSTRTAQMSYSTSLRCELDSLAAFPGSWILGSERSNVLLGKFHFSPVHAQASQTPSWRALREAVQAPRVRRMADLSAGYLLRTLTAC